jgi:hypothetical protein
MRWQWLTAAAILGGAVPASAQDGNFRRFTQNPLLDPSRNERMVYVPFAMKASGPRPGAQPYDVASAVWLRKPLGAAASRPDLAAGEGEYTLESVSRFEEGGAPKLRVVVLRRGGGGDVGTPQLRVSEARSQLTSIAYAEPQPGPGGTRYVFTLLAPTPLTPGARQSGEYDIGFRPEGEVKPPRFTRRAPTFGGDDAYTRMGRSGPQLPLAERVAGRRIEYRTGRVVDTTRERVAGSRKEYRGK